MLISTQQTTEQRIQQAIARALNIPVPDPSTPLRMGSTPGWDSMGHMMVVMELENEFNTRFASYLLPQLLDVPSIAKALQPPSADRN
jgi:acyl carrier protein